MTDEKIQSIWFSADGDYSLYLSGYEISVKYMTDEGFPYKTDFSYTNTVPALGGTVTDRYSKADGTEIRGDLLLFNYKTDAKIATIALTIDIAEYSFDNVLTVGEVDYAEPEYYYAYQMPKPGVYTNMYKGVINE